MTTETETVKIPRPLGKRLLVKRHESETTTQGGIVLPDSAQTKTQMGMVLAIGGDVTLLEKGDEILFQNLGITEVEIAGESILVMDEEDAMIVFRDPPRTCQDPHCPGCNRCNQFNPEEPDCTSRLNNPGGLTDQEALDYDR